MMKKTLVFTAILLAICLLSSTTVFAEKAIAEDTSVAEYAVSDLLSGETVDDDDYRIFDGGELLLEVRHVDDADRIAALGAVQGGGFYKAAFFLPDSNKEVFLTGLTRDNVDEIERAIVNDYYPGTDFDLKNLGFIDTEKTREYDNDDSMCWAASTANILAYTGWGAQAGFYSCDDLFELYINSFENLGGHAYYGIDWFFDGTIPFQMGVARLVDSSGGYLTDYSSEDYTETVSLNTNTTMGMRTLYTRLRRGYGISLNTILYKNMERQDNHAITLWGFVVDHDFPEDSKSYYESIFITDSDSDERRGVDRRAADDVMSLYSLNNYHSGDYDSFWFRIASDQTAFLWDAVTLQPYSDDLIKETSEGASRNRSTDPDLKIDHLYLSDASQDKETRTLFKKGEEIYYDPYISNMGDIDYNGRFKLRITVTDGIDDRVYSRDLDAGSLMLESEYYISFGFLLLNKELDVGDYILTVEVEPDPSVREAYYFNNSRSVKFKVRENYLIGDTDGNDEVSSVDVSWIGRLIAHMEVELDSYAPLRGDADGSGDLDVIDATMLQYYLADLIDSERIATVQPY